MTSGLRFPTPGIDERTDMHASPSPSTACWNCGGAPGPGHFCAACGKIQPPGDGGYFAFFALPEKLGVDREDLERRYLALSWKLHPDNFVRAGEYERNCSLELSSALNDAYRALCDPVSRAEYLLERHGVRKEGQTKQQAPPELLEEVFELNEWLDELRSAREAGSRGAETSELRERLEGARQAFEEKLAAVDAELGAGFAEWDAATDGGAGDAARGRAMARLNEVLNRRSYIRNLVASVTRELENDA